MKMAWDCRYCIFLGHVTLLLSCLATSYAIPTGSAISMLPVPPMQWLNLSNLLSGSAAPPLMDASVGYDPTSRNLLIFGGESEGGFAQSNTYLLNLDSLVWTTPTPPTGREGAPSSRSAALSGQDFAASNRHAYVVIGGKNGASAISDVWEFDYNNQFWSQVNISPGGPTPRWGASGGLDIQVNPVSDPLIPGPNNTIYLAGGTTESGLVPLSDVWELHLSGVLSSNLPNDVTGSWEHHTIESLPALSEQAGIVVGDQIIAVGGCNITATSNDSCAQQHSYVFDTTGNAGISPGPCAAPRFGGALGRNYNSFSSSFASQVFLLVGIFNDSMWDDGGGLQKGEVDVLDVKAGTWSRVLPAGDPGNSGQVAFPSPRQGAAVLSAQTTLVGSNRTMGSDTVIFGGRDASGKYLNELWLLRTYNGAITSTDQKWTGFGNGKLQTGVDANGAGVTVQYLDQCVSTISPSPASTTSAPTAPTTTPPSLQSMAQLYTVSNTHTILAPLSIGLLLPAILLLRLASPSASVSQSEDRNIALVYLSTLIVIGAYATGITSLVFSFTTISFVASAQKRSPSNITLRTGHGKAGLALFICLYGLIPILYIVRACKSCRRSTRDGIKKTENPSAHVESTDTVEKPNSINGGPASTQSVPSPSSSRQRVPGWRGHALWPGSRTLERISTDTTESTTSVVTPPRAFEVVNRPQRGQRPSTSGNTSLYSRAATIPRFLGDLDWLEQRRSLNAVGELDYALNHANRTRSVAPPAMSDMQSSLALITAPMDPFSQPELPHALDIFLRIIFHISLLAICGLTLAALWSHKIGFAVFLAWMLLFYVLLFVCAWHGRSRESTLTVLMARLRGHPSHAIQSPAHLPLSTVDQYPLQADTRGPYVHHQPPYRALGTDDVSTSQGDPRSVENDENDEEEDEDARQRRIEDEMARREVSIITVPRRKLWITNPESTGPS